MSLWRVVGRLAVGAGLVGVGYVWGWTKGREARALREARRGPTEEELRAAGLRFQRHVEKYIKAELGPPYHATHSVYVEGALESAVSEIDHVVIGPNGIHALEDKRRDGRFQFRSNGDCVFYPRHDREPRGEENPFDQNARHIRDLRASLARAFPEQARKTTFHSIVVFSDQTILEGWDSAPGPVVRAAHVCATVMALEGECGFQPSEYGTVLRWLHEEDRRIKARLQSNP